MKPTKVLTMMLPGTDGRGVAALMDSEFEHRPSIDTRLFEQNFGGGRGPEVKPSPVNGQIGNQSGTAVAPLPTVADSRA